MGNWFSKNEQVEVENNVVQVSGSVSLEEKELFILVAIICVIKLLEFIYMAYKIHHKKLKKNFIQNQQFKV